MIDDTPAPSAPEPKKADGKTTSGNWNLISKTGKVLMSRFPKDVMENFSKYYPGSTVVESKRQV